jgi:nucleotide-binding universal stress UspA family protein
VSETILVGTDGSRVAEKAVAWAAGFAKRHDAKLIICIATKKDHAAGADVAVGGAAPVVGYDDGAVEGFVHEILRRAEKIAKSAGLEDYELCEAHGHNAGAEIVKEAEARGADHLVIGSTGQTELSRLLLGSTAQSVVRHAHCPVTVVR